MINPSSEDHRFVVRFGGVTALDSINACDGCGVLFYIEGLTCVNWNDDYAIVDLYYCDQCALIRGYEIEYEQGWGYNCPKGKVWLC